MIEQQRMARDPDVDWDDELASVLTSGQRRRASHTTS